MTAHIYDNEAWRTFEAKAIERALLDLRAVWDADPSLYKVTVLDRFGNVFAVMYVTEDVAKQIEGTK